MMAAYRNNFNKFVHTSHIVSHEINHREIYLNFVLGYLLKPVARTLMHMLCVCIIHSSLSKIHTHTHIYIRLQKEYSISNNTWYHGAMQIHKIIGRFLHINCEKFWQIDRDW